MKFLVECKSLGDEDKDFVKKGLKSYMELFDIDTQVTHIKEKNNSDIAFLKAIELVSEKINLLAERMMVLENDLKEHTAIGNRVHNHEV